MYFQEDLLIDLIQNHAIQADPILFIPLCSQPPLPIYLKMNLEVSDQAEDGLEVPILGQPVYPQRKHVAVDLSASPSPTINPSNLVELSALDMEF